ncbi:MAG: C-terminal binding protein [Proteobacteria bacterium]|nr:C-terminal binding protein [Pseudomonadota bacterium]
MIALRAVVAVLDMLPGKHFASADVEQKLLGDCADVSLYRAHTAAEIAGDIAGAEVLIVWSRFALDRSIIDKLEGCRGIVCASVGYEHVDIAGAAARGITVCHVPAYATEEVADHTLALMLALVRKVALFDTRVRRGEWDWKVARPIPRLRGLRAGIVGLGRIGTAVARRLHAFGMNIGFYDPYLADGVEKGHGIERYESLDELLRQSGVVSLHAPLTAETESMLGRAQLALLDSGAILVNTARGALIDQQALIEAIQEERLAGVGVDVLDGEPVVPPALLASERVIVTPHAAWYSAAAFAENRYQSAMRARDIVLGNRPRGVISFRPTPFPQRAEEPAITTT